MRSQSLSLLTLLICIGTAPRTTCADIVNQDRAGFQLRIARTIDAKPDAVYDAMTRVATWWSPEHTYSLDAKNMYLEPEAKGWFGERLPEGGSVCHMQVVFVQPGQKIRMIGGLGPLQEFGLNGSMTWSVTPKEEGSQFELTYNVSGYFPSGLQDFAGPVDQVLTQQVDRLKKLLDAK